jgi:hypothetical protein
VGPARRPPPARRGAPASHVTGRQVFVALAIAVAALRVPAVAAQPPAKPHAPWAVGEYLEYSLKYGIISAGSGRMQVLPRDTVRGQEAWHFRFDFSGGIPGLRVNDSFDSWMSVSAQHTLRFEQRISEPGYKKVRKYEVYPDRQVFRLNDEAEKPSISEPLDESSFFYFIRTIPLEVGKSYDFNRYVDPKGNPVTIHVLRREKVKVPAGEFDAIVIQPMIKTSGMFSEGGHAELWLSDDDRRIVLQMKIKLKFGALSLYLRKFTLPGLTGTDSLLPPRE